MTEKPFEPVPPKELAVWDDQHPLPKDAADAATLRKTWHDLSEERLNHMIASDPQEYRRILDHRAARDDQRQVARAGEGGRWKQKATRQAMRSRSRQACSRASIPARFK